MKIIKTWLYNETEEPRLFTAGEAIPAGWYETPDHFGDKSKMVAPQKAGKPNKEQDSHAPVVSKFDEMKINELRDYIKENNLDVKTFGVSKEDIIAAIKGVEK